jgi:phage nucleotide-binding protein
MATASTLKVTSVADIQNHRSFAIYGRSGTGKTTFASSFPKPLLLLDIEDHGTDSINDIADIDVATIRRWSDFETIYDMLIDRGNKYKTVVFDTITQMQLLGANLILAKKRKPTVVQIDWGTMTMQDWGDLGAMMKEQITLFRNLPLEVVFLAQERVSTNDSSDGTVLAPEIGPALSPAIASHLNACVNIIASTFIKRRRRKVNNKTVEIDPVYSMRIGPSPIYVTKVRKPQSVVLPNEIDNPTYADVLEVIRGD